VGASPAYHDPLDLSSAAPARLTRPLIHIVFKLKEAFGAVRINVIGNRRSPKSNRMLEHFFQSVSKSLKFNPRQASSPPSRANSRAKEAFVGIDVSHTRKQRLIQQCSLDCQLPSAEQHCEPVAFDRERLCSWPIESISPRQVPKL
jgi:hypothetical protein